MNQTFSEEDFKGWREEQQIVGQDYFEAAYSYWLWDNEGWRSPYPEWMHEELQRSVTDRFLRWLYQTQSQEPVSDEQLGRKFDEILQQTGLELAGNNEVAISIMHPEQPRGGDTLTLRSGDQVHGHGQIIARTLIVSAGKKQLQIKVRLDSGEEWVTSFEL